MDSTVTQEEVDRLIAYEKGDAMRIKIQKMDGTSFCRCYKLSLRRSGDCVQVFYCESPKIGDSWLPPSPATWGKQDSHIVEVCVEKVLLGVWGWAETAGLSELFEGFLCARWIHYPDGDQTNQTTCETTERAESEEAILQSESFSLAIFYEKNNNNNLWYCTCNFKARSLCLFILIHGQIHSAP